MRRTPRSVHGSSVKRRPNCDPARLPSRGASSPDTSALRRRAAQPYGTWPWRLRACSAHVVLPPRGRALRSFEPARCHSAFLWRGWMPTLGCRARPLHDRCVALLAAGRSLLDFCNEFSIRRTDAIPTRRDPRPPQGVALTTLPPIVALLTQPALSSSWQEKPDPTCRSELRAIPRRPGSRPRPLRPKPEPLRATPFVRARRTWDAHRPNEPEPR